MDLLALCETIKGNAEEITEGILKGWETIAGAETWLTLPRDLDQDHLPQLIRQLAGAALCTEYDRRLCRDVVETAAQHGVHRREEGFDENLIYREYHLLRRSLSDWLRKESGESAQTYFAIMRMDALASLAGSAALHGFHRDALEQEGRWPDVLDKLIREWPLPNA